MSEIPLAKYKKLGEAMIKLKKLLPDNIEIGITPEKLIMFMGDSDAEFCIDDPNPVVIGQRICVASELDKLKSR